MELLVHYVEINDFKISIYCKHILEKYMIFYLTSVVCVLKPFRMLVS